MSLWQEGINSSITVEEQVDMARRLGVPVSEDVINTDLLLFKQNVLNYITSMTKDPKADLSGLDDKQRQAFEIKVIRMGDMLTTFLED